MESTTHEAAHKIKRLILSKGLHTGDPLPTESELCAELGISRPSVREAIRHLQALDIVNVRRGVGGFVGSLSMSALVETLAFKTILTSGDNLQALREVAMVRYYLDQGLAEKVCAVFKNTEQENLQSLVSVMEDHAAEGTDFTDEDFAFHDGILALLDNEIMRQLVNSFWQVHAVGMKSFPVPNLKIAQETALAHREMLEAAQAGEVSAYKQAVERHYAPVRALLGI